MPQESELVIKLLLEDKEALSKLRTSLNQIESETVKKTQSMSSSFTKFTVAIGAAVVATEGLRRFMGEAIRASIEQEDAINRLNVALRNQGTFTETLSKQYQDLSSSLQRNSRFADEAILNVTQRLVVLGNVGPQQMERATKATLDLATALRIDLEQASTLVAKAAAGNTAALSRYGIVIDENLTKGQKYEQLLELIGQKFGGAAQADVNTYAGASAQLGNAWGDFMEEVGNFITQNPAVVAGIQETTRVIEAMTAAMANNQTAIQSSFSGLLTAGPMGAATNLFKQLFGGSEEDQAAVTTAAQTTAQQMVAISEAAKQAEAEKHAFFNETKRKGDESYWVAAGKLRDTFSAGVSKMFTDAIDGNFKFGEALKALGIQMVKVLVDFAVQKAINFALSKTLMAGEVAAGAAAGAAMAAAWAPAAALVSLATFGANAAGAIAGIAATKAAALAAAVPGLAEGGTVTGSGTVLVGERGPEFLNLPTGARVTPLEQGLGGGGETHIHIELNNPVITKDGVAEEIATLIARKVSEIIEYDRRRF